MRERCARSSASVREADRASEQGMDACVRRVYVYIHIYEAPATTNHTRDGGGGGVFRSNKLPGLNSTGDRCPTCYYCSANQFDHTSITIIRPRRYNTDCI